MSAPESALVLYWPPSKEALRVLSLLRLRLEVSSKIKGFSFDEPKVRVDTLRAKPNQRKSLSRIAAALQPESQLQLQLQVFFSSSQRRSE